MCVPVECVIGDGAEQSNQSTSIYSILMTFAHPGFIEDLFSIHWVGGWFDGWVCGWVSEWESALFRLSTVKWDN